jgi:membrane protease YdiL (CAAX protease family)
MSARTITGPPTEAPLPPDLSIPPVPPTAFVKRHPVLSYYVLTFALSWGGLLLVIGGPGGIPATPEQFTRLIPFAILALYAGPLVGSLLLTGLVDGKAGYRVLLTRLLRWRVSVRWYAVALLTAPLVLAVVHLVLALASPIYLPGILTSGDRATFLLTGMLPALLVGLFEELGWTGFVVPRLRRRYSILATGLIVGVLWGAWHVPATDLWGAGIAAGALPVGVYMTVMSVGKLVGGLVAFRVLMVWVYDRTQSLLLAVLMHASLTSATWLLGPLAIAGMPILVSSFAEAAVLWLLVAAVAIATRGQLMRQPAAGSGGMNGGST